MFKARKVTLKNIMSLLGCGKTKAYTELREMKERFRKDVVVLEDMASYYGLSDSDMAMFI